MRPSHLFVVIAVAFLFVGCSGAQGPQIAPVSGKVTFNGEPLHDALVAFYPADGRPSMGTTDSSGNYTLSYTHDKPGAIVGQHTVRITTGTVSGEEVQKVKETVPVKYNSESELTADVKAGQNNTFDFSLEK